MSLEQAYLGEINTPVEIIIVIFVEIKFENLIEI